MIGRGRSARGSIMCKRRHPLGMAVGRRQAGIDQEARAVLHQAVADEAELRLLARSLAVEPGIGIGRRGMRLVRPLLPVEVGLGVAPATGRRLVADPSRGLKLFIEAQASISVPSTEKCSVDRSFFTRGCASTAARNFAAISPSSSRSRFFEKVEWSQTASSTPIPTNQRNSRSYSSRSISCRSERIE